MNTLLPAGTDGCQWHPVACRHDGHLVRALCSRPASSVRRKSGWRASAVPMVLGLPVLLAQVASGASTRRFQRRVLCEHMLFRMASSRRRKRLR